MKIAALILVAVVCGTIVGTIVSELAYAVTGNRLLSGSVAFVAAMGAGAFLTMKLPWRA